MNRLTLAGIGLAVGFAAVSCVTAASTNEPTALLGDSTLITFRYFDGLREARTPSSKGEIDTIFDYQVSVRCNVSCAGELFAVPKILSTAKASKTPCNDLVQGRFEFQQPDGTTRIWYVDDSGACATDKRITVRFDKDVIYALRRLPPSKW